MKKIKQIDLLINSILIIYFVVWACIQQDYNIFLGYFVVGGWQVISMIVHAYKKWFTEKGSARVVYHWITFISVITMPLGSFIILLFAAPVMALYYTWICYDEVYVKMQRPLAVLK